MGLVEFTCAVPLLAVACAFDVSQRRIPNALTLATFLIGTAAALWSGGAVAAASAVGAAVLVGLALMLPWRLRALGGGDLKLAAACGAWVGLGRLGAYALASAVAGGAISLICLAMSSAAVRREVAMNLKAAARAVPIVSIGQGRGRVSVPYGAAFAAAALWTIAQR